MVSKQPQAGQLPAEVFSAFGENGRIAFAALVAFGGRNVGMYQPLVPTVPVVLRVPPVQGLSAWRCSRSGALPSCPLLLRRLWSWAWLAAQSPLGRGWCEVLSGGVSKEVLRSK